MEILSTAQVKDEWLMQVSLYYEMREFETFCFDEYQKMWSDDGVFLGWVKR